MGEKQLNYTNSVNRGIKLLGKIHRIKCIEKYFTSNMWMLLFSIRVSHFYTLFWIELSPFNHSGSWVVGVHKKNFSVIDQKLTFGERFSVLHFLQGKNVWTIKVVLEFLFGHSKCHFFFGPKTATFGKSAKTKIFPQTSIFGL